MTISRRSFLKGVGAGALGSTTIPGLTTAEASPEKEKSEKLLKRDPHAPESAGFDRLSLSWYKSAVNRLKARLKEKELNAILLQDRWNIIYFTGLFHSTTERPFSVMIPFDTDALFWYNPGLEPRVAIIPGLISMVLGMPALSVALALAREREHGTLEQLMATPVGRLELLLGK